jgi:hypothetical protein
MTENDTNIDLNVREPSRPFEQEELSTKQVAEAFIDYTKAHNISLKRIAERSGLISYWHLNRLLTHPMAWRKCNEATRKIYEQLNAWLTAGSFPDSYYQARKKKTFRPLNSSEVYSAEKNSAPLDTASIANQVNTILKENGIGVMKLGDFLGTCVSTMLKRPMPWDKCTEFRRGVYRHLLDWSQSKEKIDSLRDSN